MPLRDRDRLRRHAAPVLLCGFAALLIGATWWTTLAQLHEQEEGALAAAARDAANIATVFQEHSTRTIQSADQAVQFVKYQYAVQGQALDLGALVDAGVILGDIFYLYSVIDEKGELILSSQHFKPGNYLDREHVRVHQQADSGTLFVSQPLLGRVTGKWTLQLTRRINRADGGFGGVVVVAMDPFYFTRVYQSIRLGANDSVALIGDDGIVRARNTGVVMGIGQDVSGTPLMAAVRAHGSGIVRTRSRIDGRDRVYAYRHLAAYPLFVTVGLDIDDQLAPFAGERRAALWKAAGFTVVIALFTALLLNLTFRLLRSHARALAASAATNTAAPTSPSRASTCARCWPRCATPTPTVPRARAWCSC
jgi:two-component system sensor histidine kinase BarA